ncbi:MULTISPECIES: DUF2742 domain-containing protein [unclassified Mycobacterium]|uniref:DUF2742 domain-containing protein n=1 Tax=unclassified Mycobacterium TaxID=2642494 RepID=UPI0029C6758C|nr:MULTISPECIES: DUF2742 domain-containing protein [unclassified Mycobacterium]
MNFPPNVARTIDWWPVHELVAPLLSTVDLLPTVGSLPWQALDDRDPVKWAAVLDGGRHWALHLDARQEAMGDASRAIATATSWASVAREVKQRSDFYAGRPWLRRVAS